MPLLGSFEFIVRFLSRKSIHQSLGNVISEKITKDIVGMLEKKWQLKINVRWLKVIVGVKTGTARKIENGHYVNKYVVTYSGYRTN